MPVPTSLASTTPIPLNGKGAVTGGATLDLPAREADKASQGARGVVARSVADGSKQGGSTGWLNAMSATKNAMHIDDARRLAARMICAGFDGRTLPESARQLIARGVGFCVLFARNVSTPEQVAKLNAEIKAVASQANHPIAICVDQEGGRVRRLRDGFTQVPSMRDVGRAAIRENPNVGSKPATHTNGHAGNGSMNGAGNGHAAPIDLDYLANGDVCRDGLVYDIGQLIGIELKAVGFDVAFAPVLDVDTNPANPVIADRSLARSASAVAHMGCQLLTGLQDVGVAACGKHFPGHGDTSQDSHYALPRLDHDIRRLSDVELVPFMAAARAGIAAIMSSHIIFGPIDDTLPATLSPAVLGGLLRQRLGYDGVVFTDDMEMKAIANFYDFDEAVIRSIEAGADVVTICHTLEKQNRAIDVLAAAMQSGRLSKDRVAQSMTRIDRFLSQFSSPKVTFNPAVLDSEPHRAVVSRVTSQADEGRDPTAYMSTKI